MFAVTTRRSTDGLGSDLVGLRNRINWFFDSPGQITNVPFATETQWLPVMDLFENAESYQLYIELPGMNGEDIELTLENEVLTIHGQKAAPQDEGYRAHRRERAFGTFERRLALPGDIDEESVQASYEAGVLRVIINKVERARARQIPVTVSATNQ